MADNAEELAEMERFYAATRTPGRPIVDPQTVFPIQRSRAESDLIAAIVADPDSDAPRLAYSAWLDSRGDPQGEFIRLQCEKARYTDKQHPRYVELDKREDEILDAHGKVWYRPLAAIGIWPNYGSSYVPSLFMRRGMIERVWVFATGVLPEEGERLWQAAPALNELWHNCITDVPRLMAIPQMHTVRDLHLSPDRGHSLTHNDVEALVNSPNLRSLRSLNWGY